MEVKGKCVLIKLLAPLNKAERIRRVGAGALVDQVDHRAPIAGVGRVLPL